MILRLPFFFGLKKSLIPPTPSPKGEGVGGMRLFTRVKNLDISFNKILEIKVKNTYCELVCNSQKVK